jgi:hypothetical protein
MPEEWLDSDGYPTETALDTIRSWKSDPGVLLEFVRGLWRYPEYFSPPKPYVWPKDWERPLEEGKEYNVSTAGWSGNESLIEALKANFVFWMTCWYSTTRGGHYVFHINEKRGSTSGLVEYEDQP